MPETRRKVVLLIVAVLACVVALFPLYWIVMTSILPTSIMLSRQPPLLPPLDAVSFDAYVAVFTRKPLLVWIGNSVLVTFGTLAVTLFASSSSMRKTTSMPGSKSFLQSPRLRPAT